MVAQFKSPAFFKVTEETTKITFDQMTSLINRGLVEYVAHDTMKVAGKVWKSLFEGREPIGHFVRVDS